MGMTKNREHKARIQVARQSTERVLSPSPSKLALYGRHLPLELGQKFRAGFERGHSVGGRTRESVRGERAAARRTAGRRRVF